MTVLSKVAKPFTPIVRRFLTDVFKPSAFTNLGKRCREGEHPENGPPPSRLLHPGAGNLPNCVALQNDDADEDAVVVTALNVFPFCCHADLLSMNREDLTRVANTLNDKLPFAMRIDTSAPRSDAFIRNSIELLVGIHPPVPPAPKANRSMSYIPATTPTQEVDEHVPPSPASPLANRSNRINSFSFMHSPPLAALEEEDEDEFDESVATDGPLHKKRRVFLHPSFSASTPSPITRALVGRSQSQRTPRSDINSPYQLGPTHPFRSQSQKLPRRKAVAGSHNVTLTRGRSSSSSYNQFAAGRSQPAAVLTSTPRKRKRDSESESDSTATSSYAEPLSSISFPSPLAPSPLMHAAEQMWLNAKTTAFEQGAADTTLGLEGMSMADEGSGSDMDISLE